MDRIALVDLHQWMPAKGQERRFGHTSAISGVPLTADVETSFEFGREGPKGKGRMT